MADWNILAKGLSDLGGYIIKDSFEQKAYERKAMIEQELLKERMQLEHTYGMERIGRTEQGQFALENMKYAQLLKRDELEHTRTKELADITGRWELEKAKLTDKNRIPDYGFDDEANANLKMFDDRIKELMKLAGDAENEEVQSAAWAEAQALGAKRADLYERFAARKAGKTSEKYLPGQIPEMLKAASKPEAKLEAKPEAKTPEVKLPSNFDRKEAQKLFADMESVNDPRRAELEAMLRLEKNRKAFAKLDAPTRTLMIPYEGASAEARKKQLGKYLKALKELLGESEDQGLRRDIEERIRQIEEFFARDVDTRYQNLLGR